MGAGYLSWKSGSPGAALPGCGDGPLDCSHVLSSRFARIFSIPVSWLATGVYASLLVAWAVAVFGGRGRPSHSVWYVLIFGASVIGAAALWFSGLQFFVLKQYCAYCLTVHACGLAAAILILLSAPIVLVMDRPEVALRMRSPRAAAVAADGAATVPAADEGVPLAKAFVAAIAGSVAPVILAIAQLLSPEPTYTIEVATDEGRPAEIAELADRERRETLSLLGDGDSPKSAASPNPQVNSEATADSTASSPAGPTGESDSNSLFDEVLEPAVATDAPEATKERWLSLRKGQLFMNAREHIVLGDSDAPHLIVELFDYTCPHCRALYGQTEHVREAMGDGLAIVLLPVPFEKKCNPRIENENEIHKNACLYASLAIAVWKYAPEAFPAFHEFLMQGERPPEPEAARTRARLLLGAERVEAARASRSIAQHIEKCVDAYILLGSGSVPKLVIHDATMTGEARSGDELLQIVRDHLGIDDSSAGAVSAAE
ncbi:MAG: vitamin K epoxide reductase family protein [Planctomycetales bacterium]|nr:vitamin K epoxide reductase family protein [Planctomycetales bacterium]